MIRSETYFKNSIVTTVSKQIAAGRNKGLPNREGGSRSPKGQEQSDSRDKRKMNTLAVYFENRTKRKGFLVNFLSKEGKKKNQSEMKDGFHLCFTQAAEGTAVWFTETTGRTSRGGENPEVKSGWFKFESLFKYPGGEGTPRSLLGVCMQKERLD